jgi:AcrR family transcriptional regulator
LYHISAEARRTERRILEQAAHVLAEDRGRSMQEIADLSGVGRTTLYRHFRTREDLMRAIRAQAIEEAHAAIIESRLDEGDPEDALRRVIAGLLNVGDRYRILVYEPVSEEELGEKHRDLAAPLYALVARGQRAGVFSPTLPSRWILAAMANLVMAAIQQVQEGELARNHAAATVADTLLLGVKAHRIANLQ